MKLKEVLSLSLDIGERMLKCGAEISRVEETIGYILDGYGIKYKEIFAMNSLIIVTIRKEDESYTESRRIMHIDKDLYQLEKLNELSRSICNENISRKEVLKKIDSYKGKYKVMPIIGGMIAAPAFTLFFGGNYKDAAISLLIALVLCVYNQFMSHTHINTLINSFISSFIIGITSILLVKIGLADNFDKIIIGNIMLLIPGLSMFISINDIFKGDTMSGLGRFTEGLFLALVVGAGVGLSLIMLGGLL